MKSSVENSDVWKLLTRMYAIKQWIGFKKLKSPKPPTQGGHLLVTNRRKSLWSLCQPLHIYLGEILWDSVGKY
jgi:hypothetical protein